MIDADISWMVDAFASGYKFTIKLAVDTHQNQGIFYLNYFVLILNMVAMSTIFLFVCSKVTMTNKPHIYQMPNLGCMLGTAYQCLLGRLSEALFDAGLDITTAEYLILRALYTSDGMQQCEICSLINKDKGAVSRCVAGLVRKGLVVTESVSHKCLRVFLSPEGRRIEPEVMKVARLRHDDLAGILTSDEVGALTEILSKIIEKS